MPVNCVRLLRAVAEQMKLEMMHYVDIEQSVWERLCSCYRFAEANRFAETSFSPIRNRKYPRMRPE